MNSCDRYEPYCLLRMKGGKWIFLNRKYKPLGVDTNEWVKYEDSPTVFSFTKEPIDELKKASKNLFERGDESYYYLYDDGCTPGDSVRYSQDYTKRVVLIQGLIKEFGVNS